MELVLGFDRSTSQFDLLNHQLIRLTVLKQVHPDTGISNRAMSILNSFVNGQSQICLSVIAHNLHDSRHLRACCNRGIQACCIQQEVYYFIARDTDIVRIDPHISPLTNNV